MIEEILFPLTEINNIKELIYYFKKAKEGKIKIAFWIGAGISKMAGYPLWDELVDHLIQIYKSLYIDDFEFKQKMKYIEYNLKIEKFKIILQILKEHNKDLYFEKIQELFKGIEEHSSKDVTIYETLSKFAKFKGVIFITTNIDRELEYFLKREGIGEDNVSIVSIDGDNSLNAVLYYLHGRIDELKSWILTDEDYTDAYVNKSKYYCSKFLEKILKDFDVLVIMGYSLREEEVYGRILSYGKKLKIFWFKLINEKVENSNAQIQYFKNDLKLNLKPIPYKGSNHLKDLLDYIYKETLEVSFFGGRDE